MLEFSRRSLGARMCAMPPLLYSTSMIPLLPTTNCWQVRILDTALVSNLAATTEKPVSYSTVTKLGL